MVYDKIVKAEPAMEMFFLHSVTYLLRFSFVKKVKKNCPLSGFSLNLLTSDALITTWSLHMLRGNGHAFASTRIFHHVMFARLQSV